MDLDKINSLKEKGNKAYVGGKYDEALDFYKEAVESVGSGDSKIAAILHSNIAQTYLQKKDYLLAVDNATESLKLDPSFQKSNLRRATANIELDNIVDAMNDLRLIFSAESQNKAAKDLMKRCSDKPEMKRELHEAYAKHYLRPKLKKLGAHFMSKRTDIQFSTVFQDALLRQSLLSTKALDIANYFFCETFVGFDPDNCAFISFFGWIPRQSMWFKYSFFPIEILLSKNLFDLLYHLFWPKTFSLTILDEHSFHDEVLLLNKFSQVYLTREEGLVNSRIIDEDNLKLMNRYSNYMTRLLYVPKLANFKENRFLKAKTLAFDGKHAVTGDFLKLWKKNEWPITSLSFIHGVPNLRSLKQFNEIVSSKVNEVFIQLTKPNHELDKIAYDKLCGNLSGLKRGFPGLNDVTFTHKHRFKASGFQFIVQDLALVRETYEIISTKPEWCPKLKVVVFIEFMAHSWTEFNSFDVKLLEQAVESFRQKYPDMKIRLCGPRFYNHFLANVYCVHAVVEFENDAASFEFAYFATMKEL